MFVKVMNLLNSIQSIDSWDAKVEVEKYLSQDIQARLAKAWWKAWDLEPERRHYTQSALF